MPWFFPWPDYIKKRACRYLLQHYLGNFLQEKLTLDQLSVDLYNGKGTIKDVALDVYSLNELLESVESPVEIIDGIIGSISISVPWSALLSDSCEIEIHGLELTLQPRYRTEENHAGGMFDSMWSSMGMTTSIQIAQECLKEEQSGKDHQPDKSQRYEGLELFAQTIESVLSRVKMTFVESVVKLEHVPKESKTGVSLEVCIKRIEYFDENASDPGSGSDQEVPQKYEPVAFALKKFHLMGVSLFCDEFPENYRTLSRQSSCESDSPIAMHTGNFSPPLSPPMPPQHSEMTARQPTYDSIHRQIEHGDPIKIASFAGRQEIKLKIKQNDRVTGPKVEIESFLGSINFFLSPRQVHLLLELAHGIASPSSSDVAPVPGRAKNKPMQPEDYDRIETELQEQLHRDRAFKQEGKRHSWTCQDDEPLHTQFLDDEEEIYFSMSASLASLAPFEQSGESDMESSVNSNFSVSTVDTNQTGNSSIARQGYGITYITSTGSPFASSIPKGAARRSHRPRKTLSELLDDPEAEMIRYKLKFSSIAMVILHENPLPSTSNNQQSVSMMTLSTSYFHEIGFGASVVGGKDYDELRERLAKACQHDHLQLIFAPVTLECDRKTSHSANAISADFSVGMLEVVEALYERSTPVSSTGTPNTENISPSYAEILTFTEEELSRRSMYTSLSSVPCFKIKVKNLTRNSGQGPNSRGSLHRPRTDIVMQFGRIRLDLDVTVVDRLNSLLHPVPLPDTDGHRNYKSFHHQNIPMSRQGYFSQAIDDTPSLSDQRIDIHVTCPFSVISVRFPIPDLRNDHERRPWWVRSLRKEILFLEVMEVGFYTKLGGSDQCSKYELTFKEMHGMLQEDPDKSPVSFIRIGPDQNDNEVPGQEGIQNGFNWPRIVVKVLPFESGPVLEEEEIDSEDSNQFSSLEDTMQFGKQEPSPFSSKKVMYDSEEMVIPGDQTEMADFAEKATNHSRMQLEFNLPNVSGFLPSKQFFELLYNRLLNDMLLWEPGAPSPAVVAEGHGVFASCRGFDFATQSLFNERFSMCKSLHANDSDSEEDSNQFDSILFESKKKKKKKSDPANFAHSQSYMAVSLNIGHGRLDLCLGAKEESGDGEKYGEAVLDFEDTNLFLVAKYQGNPDLSYLSLQANRVTMYHSGCVTPKKMSPVECVSSRSTPPHLNPCIYKSEAGAYTKLGSNVGSGSSNDSLNMLSVAIKINLDTKRKVKEIQVAIGIRGATLQHRVVLSEQSWISQLMEFFDVLDEPVPGYELPTILTELHTHLWSCAIDYRPLYLPIRSVITAETFSISSNIVYDAPVSLLRFLVEDAALFVSDKRDAQMLDLKKNYVCVMDMGFFQLSLRMSDGKDPKYPRIDLQATNNLLNIRTCVDSCDALRKLIIYFANDGDLNPPSPSPVPAQQSEESIPSSSSTSTKATQPQSPAVSTSPIAQGHFEQMQNLMEEAMKEYSSTTSESSGSNKGSPPTVINISSDKDEKPPTEMFLFPDESKTTKQSRSQQSAKAESDDDFDDDDVFCILDVPGMGIMPRDGEPEVKILSDQTIKIVKNHFSLPTGKTDLLKPPDHFPPAVCRYTLKEMSLVWYIYGGRDFESSCDERNSPGSRSPSSPSSKTSTPEKTRSKVMTGSPSFAGNRGGTLGWKSRGGPCRKLDVLMELQMNKVRMQYELYPENTEQASRQILLINDIEIRDRLIHSQINKFLYQYTSEDRPRQAHANMLMVKFLHIRPDPLIPREECCLRVAVQPLRLNIDQDSLFFLRDFFSTLSDGVVPVHLAEHKANADVSSGTPAAFPIPVQPVVTATDDTSSLSSLQSSDTQELESSTSTVTSSCIAQGSEPKVVSADPPVFYRSFSFAPEVPIRLDYQGKHLALEEGTFTGLLIGLGQLNCSELKLKRFQHRQGLLGLDKVVNYALNEWMTDIRNNQLPSILGGVGPMHSLVQLVQGVVDLVRLPIEQYQKDGRIVRGLQRGAHSFTTSTAMSALELTNRLVQAVQAVAETTYDMVSPGPSVSRYTYGSGGQFVQHRLAHQPADLREGMATAYKVVAEGLGDTADNIMRVAREEHVHKGVSGAVGGVMRQIPSTVVKPLILATEATSSVLGGVRNQLKPDARKEATDKWRLKQN